MSSRRRKTCDKGVECSVVVSRIADDGADDACIRQCKHEFGTILGGRGQRERERKRESEINAIQCVYPCPTMRWHKITIVLPCPELEGADPWCECSSELCAV